MVLSCVLAVRIGCLMAVAAAVAEKPKVISREESARHYLLGVAELAKGKPLRAAWEFTWAVHCDPTNADAWFARALVFDKYEQAENTIADLTRVLRLGPDADAYQYRAYWYAMRGNHRAALADLNQSLEIAPRNEVALCNRGGAHKELGNLKAALADFNSALELDPKYVDALVSRGFVRGRMGDFAEAIADLDEAHRLDPESIAALLCRAEVHMRQARYDKAIADTGAILALDASCSRARHLRAIAYFEAGQSGLAIDEFNELVRCNPKDHDAVCNRGCLHAQLGHELKAEIDFARAIELKPDDARAHFSRGELHAKSGDLAVALRSFTKTIELDPTRADAYRKRAAINNTDGRHAAVLADLEKVAELEPTAGAYKELARFRLDCPDEKFRDAKKAVELADKAWAMARIAASNTGQPHDLQYDELRASAAASAGDMDRAVKILRVALSDRKPICVASHSSSANLPPLNGSGDPPVTSDDLRVSEQLERYERLAALRRSPGPAGRTDNEPSPLVLAGAERMPPLPPLPTTHAMTETGKGVAVRPPAELPPQTEIGKPPPGDLPPIRIPVLPPEPR